MDFEKLTVKLLKEECKKRGLSVTGRKHELIEKLSSYPGVMSSDPPTVRRSPRGEGKTGPTMEPLLPNGTAHKKLPVHEVNGHLSSSSVTDSGGESPGKVSQSVSQAVSQSVSQSVSQCQSHRERMKAERVERENITLLWRPLTTLQYFIMEMGFLCTEWANKLRKNKKTVSVVVVLVSLLMTVYHIDGSHQEQVAFVRHQVLWCLYWVGLGVLSSVGLGTGLHTFLLYLGPHIAAVTLAAYECDGLDFPSPPYPDEIVCPERKSVVSLWTIMSKVRLEAMMWGVGTAIGELPPYFMARTARLSGKHDEDEEDEFEELEELVEHASEHHSILERAKIYVHNLVKRVGFAGILLCASIPNPLFDLAGITCGHFLIPFWTFFGATLIGKAIVKTHIQKLFVIFVFSEHHVENAVKMSRNIPYVGVHLYEPFKTWLKAQKDKWHHRGGAVKHAQKENLLSWVFEKILLLMLLYFVMSIVNSLAQRYHKRLCKARHEAHIGKKQE